MPEHEGSSLNANHARRLSVTCRYLDKLLAEMENALNISASRCAFPPYIADIVPAQRQVIEDYIARIRVQLVHVLEALGIERPAADIPVSRSLHATATFIDIAVEELKPEYMRGYGEVPEGPAGELRIVAGDLKHLVGQLDHYVIYGEHENPQQHPQYRERPGEESR